MDLSSLHFPLGLALAALAISTPVPSQRPPQNQDAFASLLGRYPGQALGKVSPATFLAQAAAAGLIRTPADRLAAKRAFADATLRGHGKNTKGRRGNAFNTQPTACVGMPAGSGPQAAVNETEWNDSIGWADDLAGQTQANGAMSANDDRDFFRFVVAGDSVLTIAVTGSAPAVDDPDLELFDVNGFRVDYNDDAVGYYPGISLVVPGGVYYAAVGCPYASTFGNYTLSLSMTPTTIPTIVSGTPTNGTINGIANPTYRLIVGSDSRITSTVTGSANADLFMDIRTATGQTFHFTDDSSVSYDPGFNSNLPAGIYYVTFGEWSNATGSFSFTFNVTSAAAPALACGTPVTGNINGDEDFDLYRLVVPSAQRVALATAANGTVPMADTVLHLFDAQLHEFAYNDENGNVSSFSLLETPLPAGVYWVANRGYYGDYGGYSLSATCNPGPSVTPVAWGMTTTSLVTPGLSSAYSFQVGTQNPVEFKTATGSSSVLDTQIAVLNSAGICQGWDDDSFGVFDSASGGNLTEGTYWLLVRDWYNATGSFDLHVHPPLAFEDAVTNRTLGSRDKAGNANYVFVGINVLPTGILLPPPITGKLLIDLSLYVQLGPVVTPGSGTIQWVPSLQGYPGLVAQGISVVPTLTSARMTDIVK